MLEEEEEEEEKKEKCFHPQCGSTDMSVCGDIRRPVLYIPFLVQRCENILAAFT